MISDLWRFFLMIMFHFMISWICFEKLSLFIWHSRLKLHFSLPCRFAIQSWTADALKLCIYGFQPNRHHNLRWFWAITGNSRKYCEFFTYNYLSPDLISNVTGKWKRKWNWGWLKDDTTLLVIILVRMVLYPFYHGPRRIPNKRQEKFGKRITH